MEGEGRGERRENLGLNFLFLPPPCKIWIEGNKLSFLLLERERERGRGEEKRKALYSSFEQTQTLL